MDWVLVLHLTCTAVVVVSLLCGDWPIFHGTPFQSINHFITVGAHDLLLRGTEFFCGNKGRNAFLRIENYCCERPNPILQILYFATIGVIYYVALKSSSFYIPGYYVSNIHWYGSIGGLVIGICLFLITSISDPGTIDSKNASRYLSTYSFDGVIYINKQCSTCNIPRPARSKHCSICDRCVARFDHHCGWMNNCIGEKNLRYFLAFLLWHAFLCLYGVVILIAILLGEWKKQRVALILTVYYGIENSFTKLAPHFVQWALNFYRTQVLLVSFLAIMFLLLAGFLCYHTYLVVMNMTTNETYKWDEYKRWQQSLTKVKAATESLNQSSEVSNAGQKIQGTEKVQDSKCSLIYFRLKLKNLYGTWKNRSHDLVIKNVYDEGLMHNIREVFYPISCRRSFFMTKAD